MTPIRADMGHPSLDAIGFIYRDDPRGKLTLHGEVVEDSEVYRMNSGPALTWVWDDAVWSILDNASTLEVRELLDLHFGYPDEHLPWDVSARFGSRGFQRPTPTFQFELRAESEEWTEPFSLRDLAHTLKGVIAEQGLAHLVYEADEEVLLNGITILWLGEDDNRALGVAYDEAVEIVEKVVNETHRRLVIQSRENALVTLFNFPPSVQAPCAQYLSYFVQFLADLGIAAESELTQKAHGVLFTITPADGKEGLVRVREALDLYLELPAKPQVLEETGSTNVAVQQLAATVYHLKGQLLLTNAALQAKDAAIEALQLSNLQYRALLPSHRPDREPLMGGVVQVKEYEGKGFSIDLPGLLRKLKRVL